MKSTRDIIVTTGDLKQPYQVIGPVYFQISNKGVFSSSLSKLTKAYQAELKRMKADGQISKDEIDWGFLYGEWSIGQTDFDKAFFIAVEELKKRAALLEADAVIGMRQDIDLDTNAFQYFYLQMYGTAVWFVDQEDYSIEPTQTENIPVGPVDAAPFCSVCGVTMIIRTVERGERKGQRFYVCPNYSECKQVIPITPKDTVDLMRKIKN